MELGHHPTSTGQREKHEEGPGTGCSRHRRGKKHDHKDVWGTVEEKGRNEIQCKNKYSRARIEEKQLK